MTDDKADRKRVQLDMTRRTCEQLDDLLVRCDAASRAEVVRRALSVYAVLVSEHEAGRRVEVHDPAAGLVARLILP